MTSKKSKSAVRDFFTLSKGDTHTICNLCQDKQKYFGGTSSMPSHLKLVHKRSADSSQKTLGQMKLQVTNSIYIHVHASPDSTTTLAQRRQRRHGRRWHNYVGTTSPWSPSAQLHWRNVI